MNSTGLPAGSAAASGSTFAAGTSAARAMAGARVETAMSVRTAVWMCGMWISPGSVPGHCSNCRATALGDRTLDGVERSAHRLSARALLTGKVPASSAIWTPPVGCSGASLPRPVQQSQDFDRRAARLARSKTARSVSAPLSSDEGLTSDGTGNAIQRLAHPLLGGSDFLGRGRLRLRLAGLGLVQESVDCLLALGCELLLTFGLSLRSLVRLVGSGIAHGHLHC